MRFMILIRGNRDTEAGVAPAAAIVAAMAAYHGQLAQAGVLLDASALEPSATGLRVRWQGGRRTLVEGPLAASDRVVAGYTLIEVKSRAEGVEWAKRFPPPFGEDAEGEIEVRPLHEHADLGAAESTDRSPATPVSTSK